ncbi:hypothetical protein Q8A64_00005, partial [Oxalobacteraceae bacterium R-40]|nr:hypothetical protein [Oxalobacteraceae bacterium R-40]
VDSVKRVTDIMAEITAASNEQSAGIEQVNQAIAQMDQVTQQNAALVEQAAAAAESMQHQAAGLTQTVSVFKLDGNQFMIRHAPQTTGATPVRQAKPASVGNRGEHKARLAAQDARPTRPALAATGNADDWEEF